MRLIRDKITDTPVTDESDLRSCCNSAIRLAEELGFNRGVADDIAALAADMINHVVSHRCEEGHFFVCRILDSDNRQGLEMWSCDNGDAISDVLNDVEEWSFADSLPEFVPTTLQQLSDEFEINPSWWPDFITVPRTGAPGSWIRIYSRKWLETDC
jgi:hypothetical protein